jgi:uncharacterized delta-60 repeat protein
MLDWSRGWLGLILLALTARLAGAAAGDPDLSFGTAGATITTVGDISEAYAMVRQSDGKLVVGGYVQRAGHTTFLLIRYLGNGTIDPTFGTDGIVETNAVPPRSTRVKALLSQPDGSLVAVGMATILNYWDGGGDVVLARYQPDGALDPTFGSGGIVVTDVYGYDDQGTSALLAPDGKIVVAGFARTGTSLATQDAMIARYLPNGTLDSTFGTGGVTTIDFSGRWDRARDLVRQSDGGIVYVGSSIQTVAPYNEAVGIVGRLDANGSPDGAFGAGGSTQIDLGLSTHLFLVVLLADGRIMAAVSYSPDGIDGHSLLARFAADGSLDLSFGGGDGFVEPTLGPIFAMEAGPGNTILTGGGGFLWGHWYAMGVSRYDTDGNADLAFGYQGRASIYPGAGIWNSGTAAVVAEPDGSAITLAGFAADGPYDQITGSEPRKVAIARVLGTAPPCAGDADCDVCERCDSGVCRNGPRTTCEHPTGRGARLVYASDVRRKPRLRWKWQTVASGPGFDGSVDDVGLCMWWGDLPIYEGRIPAGAGWTAEDGTVRYGDRLAAHDGLQKIRIGHGLEVKAKGEHMRDNQHGFADALLQPADQSIPLNVQLHASSGKCFAATYPQSSLSATYAGHVRRGDGH